MATPPPTPPEPVPQETAPPRPPRRRRCTTDRRTTIGGDALTPTGPNGRPEHVGVNAYTADDPGTLTVIVQPRDFRLPDVLRHIEAGKVVLVMPQHNGGD